MGAFATSSSSSGGGGTITGEGTPTYYAVFTSATGIGSGYIYQDDTHGTPYVIYIADPLSATLVNLNVSGTVFAPSFGVNGVGGLGYVNYIAQSSAPSTPSSVGYNMYANSQGYLSWVSKSGGGESDTYTRTLDGILTANRVYTLQDATMTLAGTAAIYGGTGQSTVTTGDLLYGSAANTWSKLASGGTAGMFLRSAGASTAPTWSTLVLPNAATLNQIIHSTASNTWGGNANFLFDTVNSGLIVGTTAMIASTDIGLFDKAQNNSTYLKVRNTNASGAATAGFTASNGTTLTNIYQSGTGYTTSGNFLANQFVVAAAGAGGAMFYSSHASGAMYFYTNATERMRLLAAGGIYVLDGNNFLFDTTTGTKIATSTSQKIAFWNATPIVQPTTAVASSTFVANASANIVYDESTFDGYKINQVVKALRNAGLLA